MDLVKSSLLSQQLIEKYERDAGKYWDLFYKRNEDRFFKDRHYFDREFPELLRAATVLEVGCGVGNTIFPLLQLNPEAFVYACDFAPSAVALVRSHPEYAASGRVHAFVADITAGPAQPPEPKGQHYSKHASEHASASAVKPTAKPLRAENGANGGGSDREGGGGLVTEVPPGGIDACCMVFVLSAISPERMPQAVRNVARTLRPGSGQVLFRDYAVGDLAQDRLGRAGRAQRIADNFYARWDGTRAYYFSEEGLRALFEAEGFRCEYVVTHERIVENRRKQERMDRRYIQAVFTYCGGGTAGIDGPGGTAGGSSGTVHGTTHAAQRAQQGQHAAAAERPLESTAGGSVPPVAATAAGAAAASAAGSPPEGILVGGRSCAGSTRSPPEVWEASLGPVTFTFTGAAPSSAQRCLARLLVASPSTLLQRTLLELGSHWQAPTGLPSLAALRWCRFAVATAPTSQGMAAVRYNARRNAPLVIVERLRLQQLSWQGAGATPAVTDAMPAGLPRQQPGGPSGWSSASASWQGEGHREADRAAGEEQVATQRAALRRAFPAGFDVVVGADMLSREAGGQEGECLAGQLAALLAPAPHAVVLLCQSSECASGGSCQATGGAPPATVLAAVAKAAARFGLEEAQLPGSAQLEEALQQALHEGVEILCLGRSRVCS